MRCGAVGRAGLLRAEGHGEFGMAFLNDLKERRDKLAIGLIGMLAGRAHNSGSGD
jgi:hypothetical protein